jgi:hypothetical protein|tara:strand:- start:446 stop:835 length:390 start_codon:yes stop_codon:yes gene_type:complete
MVFDSAGNHVDGVSSGKVAKKIVNSSSTKFNQKKYTGSNRYYNKPGSALESIIPKWAAQFAKGCGCRDMRIKMDRWGTTGCLHREDTIVAHLMQQPEKVVAIFKNIPMPIRRAAARRLFEKAIALSKQE